MSLRRRVGLGVVLECDTAGGVNFATVGSIVDALDGPHAKADIVHVPILSDSFVEKVKALVDGGECTLQIAWDPDDATTALFKSQLREITTCATWRISYPGGTIKESFAAWVSALGATRKIGGFITGAVTLAVNGDPG